MSKAKSQTSRRPSRGTLLALKQQAERDYRDGSYDKADAGWLEIFESFPTQRSTASIFRARIARRQGRVDDAIDNYRAALEALPDHGEALRYVFGQYAAQGDIESASRLRDQLAAENPDSKGLAIAEAFIAQGRGQIDDMLAGLKAATGRWHDEVLHVQYIDGLRHAQRYDEALEAIDTALARFPDSVRLENRRAAAIRSLLSRAVADGERDLARIIHQTGYSGLESVV